MCTSLSDRVHRRCVFVFFCLAISPFISFFFFFNDTATTEIYTLSLHDALPIFHATHRGVTTHLPVFDVLQIDRRDRKSTRLNSSHLVISYAVFCLKKKKNTHITPSKASISP